LSRPHLVLVNAIHGKFGGGRVHLLEVLPRLARLGDPQVRYLALVRADQSAELREAGVETRVVAAPRHFALSFLWDQAALPLLALRLRAGLVFSPANYGPWLLGRRCLLLVRNTFEAAEAWASRGERLYWRLQEAVTRWSVRTARGGMVVSEAFRKTVAPRLGIPEAWLVVNHHGHASVFRAEAEPGDADAAPPGRYLLVVSDLYPHKNLERVLEAAAEVRRTRPDVRLCVVGTALMSDYAARLRARARALGLGEDCFRGPLPQRALPPLYRRAAAVLCLSLAESFGMPQLEAMACGAPVVASDLPVFREISGDAAVYADPTDVASMARAMAAVLEDGVLAARLSETGRGRARYFTWDRCAQVVHAEVRRRLGLPSLAQTAGDDLARSASTVTRKA
jgi:glycosyltransferase involved in cell wall biosynthesis